MELIDGARGRGAVAVGAGSGCKKWRFLPFYKHIPRGHNKNRQVVRWLTHASYAYIRMCEKFRGKIVSQWGVYRGAGVAATGGAGAARTQGAATGSDLELQRARA